MKGWNLPTLRCSSLIFWTSMKWDDIQSMCYYACEQVCSNGNSSDVCMLRIHFQYHLAHWLSWLEVSHGFPSPSGQALILRAGIAQSVQWLATGCMVWGWIPVRVRFAATVQTGPGLHSAYCTMDTGLFPGGKAAGVWRWPLTPSSAEVKEWVELYL